MSETIAIILAIGAAIVWSFSGHVDKFMIRHSSSNEDKNIKGLLFFSTFIIGLIAFPICFALAGFNIGMSSQTALISMAASALYTTSVGLYLKAMKKSDASVVMMMFQLIPIMLYVPSVLFYNETFTIPQIIGSVLIIIASIRIGIDPKKSRKEGRYTATIFAFCSALFCAAYYMLMDYAIRQENYFACLTWYQVGLIICGITMLCVKKTRKAIKSLLTRNGKVFIGLNIFNEVLNESGVIFENVANSVLPIALINVISGLQGGITFVIGIIGVKLFPKYFSEKIDRKTFITKTICILVSIVGFVLIFV